MSTLGTKQNKPNSGTVADILAENKKLLVSVLVPCRNEAKFIGKCLNSIITNDYAKEKLEILVIDGMSDDGSRNILEEYMGLYPFIKLLENRRQTKPHALNLGIRKSRGEIVMIVDAHAVYEKDYIQKSIIFLNEYGADNVGGILRTLPGDDSFFAQSIAIALSHPFGVGNALFRIGLKEPQYVDTVPFGCYRREVFDKIGLFNERLVRNQDIEFNLRLRKAGGKNLLVPEIVSHYNARPDLSSLFKQNFANGYWVIYSMKFAHMPFSIRHLIPLAFVLSLLGSMLLSVFNKSFVPLTALILIAYIATSIAVSLKLSFQKGINHLLPLVLSFATLHFSYGLGSIWGIMRALTNREKEND